jgi:hypothetical protein
MPRARSESDVKRSTASSNSTTAHESPIANCRLTIGQAQTARHLKQIGNWKSTIGNVIFQHREIFETSEVIALRF